MLWVRWSVMISIQVICRDTVLVSSYTLVLFTVLHREKRPKDKSLGAVSIRSIREITQSCDDSISIKARPGMTQIWT